MKKSVLVLGDYQQSIAVVRSLGRAGYRVVVGRTGRRSFIELSRHTREVHVLPGPDDRAFLPALTQLLDRQPGIGHLFPVGEAEICAVLRAHGELQQRVALAVPPPDVVRACLDKPTSMALAARLGVPLPRTHTVTDFPTLFRQAAALGARFVVKPPDSTRLLQGRKALICDSTADLNRHRHTLTRADFPLVLQRWQPGDRHNCQFAARSGRIKAFFQQRVIRTDRRDGTGFGVEGVSQAPSRELRHYCDSMVAALGYDGVGCAQFLVDPDSGESAFLELNPRLDATCELPLRCGYDFPRLAVERATPVLMRYPQARRFHWMLGDLRALGGQLRAGEIARRACIAGLGRALAAHWRAHCRLTGAWTDPLPALYLYGHAAFSVASSHKWERVPDDRSFSNEQTLH